MNRKSTIIYKSSYFYIPISYQNDSIIKNNFIKMKKDYSKAPISYPSVTALKQVFQRLQCPICYNQYDATEHLPMITCQKKHKACKDCVQQIVDQTKIICPMCRRSMDKTKIKKDKISHTILSMIDAIRDNQEQLCENFNQAYEQLSRDYKWAQKQIASLRIQLERKDVRQRYLQEDRKRIQYQLQQQKQQAQYERKILKKELQRVFQQNQQIKNILIKKKNLQRQLRQLDKESKKFERPKGLLGLTGSKKDRDQIDTHRKSGTFSRRDSYYRIGINYRTTNQLNSCLQCLLNTCLLTQYFLNKQFKAQITVKKQNQIFIKEYFKFVKQMYSSRDEAYNSKIIAQVLKLTNSQYLRQFSIQSNKFLSQIILQLHRGLNRIDSNSESMINFIKVQSELANQSIQMIEDNADELIVQASQIEENQSIKQQFLIKKQGFRQWLKYIKKSQSFISDIMVGQIKQKMLCNVCRNQQFAIKSEAIFNVSIPQYRNRSLTFFLIFNNFQRKTIKVIYEYTIINIKQLIKKITSFTQLVEKQIVLYLITKTEGIYKLGRQPIRQIELRLNQHQNKIIALQLSEKQLSIADLIQMRCVFSTRRNQNEWYKFPLFLSRQSTTGLDIYKRVLEYLYNSAFPGFSYYSSQKISYELYEKVMLQRRPFEILLRFKRQIVAQNQNIVYDYKLEAFIQDQEKLENVLKYQNVEECELQFRFKPQGAYYFDFIKLLQFEQTKKISQSTSYQNFSIQLKECLSELKKHQQIQLNQKNYCKDCQKNRLFITQAQLFKASKILVLNLDRFKRNLSKNQTNVKFPQILDLKPYLTDTQPMDTYLQEAIKQNIYIPPNYSENMKISSNKLPIYELYAVKSHQQNIQGDTYKAYVKKEERWYEIIDQSIRGCSFSQINGRQVQMLFYVRKQQ